MREDTEIKENVVVLIIKESEVWPQWESGLVLETFFYFALCACISALPPGRLQALQLSFPPHATPSPPSLAPSIPGGAAA